MNTVAVSIFAFVLLSTVALLSMCFCPRLPERHRDTETTAAVGKIANIFVVMTSLVFGLLITSSKSTFEAIDRNIHSYATDLILLDKDFRNYGDDAADARKLLQAYVQEAIAHPAQTDDLANAKDDTPGRALDRVGVAINQIRPSDSFHEALLTAARSQYGDVVRQRWIIVEQSEGSIPHLLIVMLLAWLTIIFASYGYRAPRNAVVVSMVVVSALLISASLYLVLDMNIPFKGPIRISYEPYRRALHAIKAPN